MLSTLCYALLSVSLAAPAPKGAPSNELLKLLPADTATVFLVDCVALKQSEIGKLLLAKFASEIADFTHLKYDFLLENLEHIVAAQYQIEKFAGDWVVFFQFKKAANIPKTIQDHLKKDETRFSQTKIGEHAVFRLSAGPFVSAMNETTLALVYSFQADKDQEKSIEDLKALLDPASSNKPQISPMLKQMLEKAAPTSTIVFYGAHEKTSVTTRFLFALVLLDLEIGNKINLETNKIIGSINITNSIEFEILADLPKENKDAEKKVQQVLDEHIKAKLMKDTNEVNQALMKSAKIEIDNSRLRYRGKIDSETIKKVLKKD